MKKKKMIKRLMSCGVSRNDAALTAKVLRKCRDSGISFKIPECWEPEREPVPIQRSNLDLKKVSARYIFPAVELLEHPSIDYIGMITSRLRDRILEEIIRSDIIDVKISKQDQLGYITVDASLYVAQPEVV